MITNTHNNQAGRQTELTESNNQNEAAIRMKLRPLIETPFRKYALFSGRAGRAEFWLFILTFIVITQLAWLLGHGVMKIVGFDRNHDETSPHHMMHQSENGDTLKDGLSGAQPHDRSSDDGSQAVQDQNGQSSGMSERDYPDRHGGDMLRFMIHWHGGDGYHLHGVMRDSHMFDDDRQDIEDDNGHGRYKYRGYHRDRHADIRFHNGRAERGGDIIWMISVAALLLPLLAVGARRLHDSNHSGWWQLLMLIPVAGWLVLVVFFLLPGEEEDNRFGAPSAI